VPPLRSPIATALLTTFSALCAFPATSSAANRRYFSLILEFSLDGAAYSLSESWACRRSDSSHSTTPGWDSAAQTVVRQISPQRAVFFHPPAECDIEEGATYATWLGVFPDISDADTFDIYPGLGSGQGDSGVVQQVIVHQTSRPGPEHASTALEQRLKTVLDKHQWEYKALTGAVLFEPEWRDQKEASIVDVLERSTAVTTSWEVSNSSDFPVKPLALQSLQPIGARYHQSVRVLNTTYSNGVWMAGKADNFVRFTATQKLPALTGKSPTDPIMVEYKGKRGRLQGDMEFYDPQDKTIIRFSIDYLSIQNMKATYTIHTSTPPDAVSLDYCGSPTSGCILPVAPPEL
jgi:hypothetical protein